MKDENKATKIAILKKVCELLPLGEIIEARIVYRLQATLKDYQKNNAHTIYNSNTDKSSSKPLPARHIAKYIEEEFEDITETDFAGFKLTIGKDALIRFIDNVHYSHNGGRQTGVDSKNNSIRLIAAFLAAPETDLLSLSDLEANQHIFHEAQNFKKFMQSATISEAEISLNSLDGVYIAAEEEQSKYAWIALDFRMSTDSSHLIVKEHLQSISSDSMASNDQIKSFGWGIITDHNIFHIALRRSVGYAHTYQSMGLPSEIQKQIDNCKKINALPEIALMRFDKAESYQSSEKQSLRAELAKQIDSNLFIFEKDTNLLTFPKRIDDKNKDSESTIPDSDPFWGDFKSINSAEATERSDVMDEEEKEKEKVKLGDKLIHTAAYSGNVDEILDLLKQGAPVNFQDPETGCALLHLIAEGANLAYYEEIKAAAHDAIDPLVRDNCDHMPSVYAVNNKEIGEILREEEIKAAAKQGYYPGITSDKNKQLEKPHNLNM